MTTVDVAAETAAREASQERAPAALPRRVALPAAVAAGLCLLAAFPPVGLWWLAVVGVALLAVAVHRRTFRGGAGLGLLAGLVFFVPLLSWTHIVGGQAPWLILSGFEAAYLGLMAGAATLLSRLVDRYRWLWPVGTGSLWVAQEALRDRYPFGGFPWGRLAFAQGDSPLLRLALLGGAPLVSFAVAAAGGLLAAAAWRPWRRPGRAAVLSAAAWAGGALAVLLVGLAVPVSRPGGPAVTVAVVQGNVPRMGLEFNAQRRAVLDNHVNATLELAAQVKAGTRPRPDLVVWPENASDIDPLVSDDTDARLEIDGAAAAIGAPILVGAVLDGPGDHARNAGIVWNPGTGPDPTMYVKQHPVPFAEYMPLRSLARLVSSRVDLVRSDFVAGDRPGVLRMGSTTIGDVICFEVAYDDLVRATVTGGAQLLTVQTNNADFDTAEARQQLAMVRLRAVESGRDALMASTVGVSAFVTADGSVFDATRLNTRAVLVRELRLGSTRTLAVKLGAVPEYILVGVGLAVLAWAVGGRRRTWRETREAL